MTREETIKILAILKAAYPNSYRNMSKDEANGTVMVWAMQFANIPADIVLIAVNKLISTSDFPPAICEVKDKIRGLYWEVWEELEMHRQFKTLPPEKEAFYRRIYEVVEPLRNGSTKQEPSINELTSGGNLKVLIEG